MILGQQGFGGFEMVSWKEIGLGCLEMQLEFWDCEVRMVDNGLWMEPWMWLDKGNGSVCDLFKESLLQLILFQGKLFLQEQDY